VPRTWSIPALVASSDLIAIVPRQFAAYAAPRFDLDIHEMPVKMPVQHMHMAWHAKMDSDPATNVPRGFAGDGPRAARCAASETSSNVTPFTRPRVQAARTSRTRSNPPKMK